MQAYSEAYQVANSRQGGEVQPVVPVQTALLLWPQWDVHGLSLAVDNAVHRLLLLRRTRLHLAVHRRLLVNRLRLLRVPLAVRALVGPLQAELLVGLDHGEVLWRELPLVLVRLASVERRNPPCSSAEH